MPVKPPTLDELWRIAQDYYMDPAQPTWSLFWAS